MYQESKGVKEMKIPIAAMILWVVCWLAGIAILAGAIYAATHFISKYW